MATMNADIPIPSTETGGPAASNSTPASPIFNRLRTPSVSVTPPSTAGARDESQGEVTAGLQNAALSDRASFSGLSGLAAAVGAVAIRQDNVASLSPEPSRSRTGTPRARRRSSSGVNQSHNVADEELPDDAFHSPEFQGAFRDAKQLMSNVKTVLGSSALHNEPESTMRTLYQEAGRLANFEYPATRTVGFVGDSGVGKSSLLNSLLDTKGLARTSNNGEACTCVVTEYHYHNRNTFDIQVNLFTIDELRSQLTRMLDAYRNFELHQNEAQDAAERHDMEASAKVARDTFHAMFRGRLNDEAFLVNDPYVEVVDRLTRWASEAKPSPLSTRYTGVSLQVCSDRLLELSSEPPSRNSPAKWPYIRSIKVLLNAHILSRGLILVDLPGLRDLNSARRIITERYLLQCDEIFAICNIGRAVTDEGVQQVFDLAGRARLSNVGIVCTRSDDINAEEAIRDWPGERARRIERFLDNIEGATKEIDDLQRDIEDYEGDDLSDEERRELDECYRDQNQARIRKKNYEFELKDYLVQTRNQIITGQLRTLSASRTESMRFLNLSGILLVRKHCISIVAHSQRRIATRYMKDEIPALLADIELWVQSGARTATEERREALCQSLNNIEQHLRRDFTSHAFNRLARVYNEEFTEHIYSNRRIAPWSASALAASRQWGGWHPMSYSAFCRKFGNHFTPAVGAHNWNEEAMEEMVRDLESPWQELRAALQQRQDDLLSHVTIVTDTAIEQLETLEQDDNAATLVVQALNSRQSLFLDAIEEVNEKFEADLKLLRIDSLSGIRSSLFGRAMESFYNRCNGEGGTGSDARRKAIIKEVLGSEDIFIKLMRSFRNGFRANSESVQTRIQEATTEYLNVVQERFDFVRSENVARESEHDPDFRLRVDEVAKTGRDAMQRVHGVL
ncbi:hypothetical protein FSARC_9044 [Fusarium sarcochroum]|uniref:Uncharacterized protein n=1 Tax=Fusarium sarcochroum TaxID=1208366 RepID=A0A8H4TRW7_9HYPO|nr:hypothetical protein FSARC_9044 [Fusarium sarcochroum]